jgi:hypothetical protein
LNTKKSNLEKKEKLPKKRKVNLSKYPRLDKKKTTKARKDLIDYDYLDKLNEEELKLLNQFTDEYYCANFKGETLHPKKYKKDCEKRNNDRNIDLLTIKEITGGINYSNFGKDLDELHEAVKNKENYSGLDEVLEELEQAPVSLKILKKLTE